MCCSITMSIPKHPVNALVYKARSMLGLKKIDRSSAHFSPLDRGLFFNVAWYYTAESLLSTVLT